MAYESPPERKARIDTLTAAMEDPRFIEGFRDGRDGKPRADYSEPYQIGYREGLKVREMRRQINDPPEGYDPETK